MGFEKPSEIKREIFLGAQTGNTEKLSRMGKAGAKKAAENRVVEETYAKKESEMKMDEMLEDIKKFEKETHQDTHPID